MTSKQRKRILEAKLDEAYEGLENAKIGSEQEKQYRKAYEFYSLAIEKLTGRRVTATSDPEPTTSVKDFKSLI